MFAPDLTHVAKVCAKFLLCALICLPAIERHEMCDVRTKNLRLYINFTSKVKFSSSGIWNIKKQLLCLLEATTWILRGILASQIVWCPHKNRREIPLFGHILGVWLEYYINLPKNIVLENKYNFQLQTGSSYKCETLMLQFFFYQTTHLQYGSFSLQVKHFHVILTFLKF